MSSWITFDQDVFRIATLHTSYLIRVTPYKHLEQIHYGGLVNAADAEALSLKRVVAYGNCINYNKKDDTYCLNVVPSFLL